MSGPLHCTGEAIYADDIPLPPDTLQAALVLTNQCGCVFEAIDTAPALGIPGVVGVYTYEDVLALAGNNEMGPIQRDELVFLPLGCKIKTVGEVLGIVVAESLESAELGARMVKIQYGKPEGKIVVTVDDAIDAGSFYDFSRHCMECGDVTVLEKLESMPDTSGTGTRTVGETVKVSGTFRSGSQDHFYLGKR
jgi:xanthine dehydrogenase/oxidase